MSGDHNMNCSANQQPEACEVPLTEQLESVWPGERLVIDDADGMGTRYIPVGRMCHEAAAELRRLHAENEALTREVAALSANALDDYRAIERLQEENFKLAAGQCLNVVGDEGGAPYCRLRHEVEDLSSENIRLHELAESEGRWASEYLARAVKAEALNAQLLEALEEERRVRLMGQEDDVHWESLRDQRRAAIAATDAAIAAARREA